MSNDLGYAIILFTLGFLIEIMYLTTDTLSWLGASISLSLCWFMSFVLMKSVKKES